METTDKPTYEISQEIIDLVWSAAKGCYQQGLLKGYETWSGSSLRGKAARWSARYAESRWHFVVRIDKKLPVGWSAYDALVPLEGRFRRRLIIDAPDDTKFDWLTKKPIGSTFYCKAVNLGFYWTTTRHISLDAAKRHIRRLDRPELVGTGAKAWIENDAEEVVYRLPLWTPAERIANRMAQEESCAGTK